MKTIYPIVALLSAAIVAAGPVPRVPNIYTRSNNLAHASNQPRTEPAVPGPALAAAQADAEHKKAADLMEAMHVAKAEAEAKASQDGTNYWLRGHDTD
jgi:hypothetical protein